MDGLAKTKEYGQIFADPGTAKIMNGPSNGQWT